MNEDDIPKHKCSFSITHNRHKDYFQTIDEYVSEHKDDFENEESRLKAIQTDSVWEMQWYPETPNGFIMIFAPTLEELVSFSKNLKFEATGL